MANAVLNNPMKYPEMANPPRGANEARLAGGVPSKLPLVMSLSRDPATWVELKDLSRGAPRSWGLLIQSGVIPLRAPYRPLRLPR